MRDIRLPRHRLVLALVVSAAVGAGCGGSAAKTSTKTTVPPPVTTSTVPVTTVAPATTTTVAPPTTIDPALAAKAAAAVLQPGDFPYGWAAQPSASTGGLQIQRLWQDLTHCLNVDNTPPTPVLATSPDFKMGLATQAVSTVEYTTASSAAGIAAALGGPMLAPCLADAFNANSKLSAPQGATPGPAVVTVLTPPALGDKAFDFRVNVTMNLGSLQIRLFHDFVVVFKGGTVIRMWFLNPGSGFPPTLEQTLVQDVVSRA